MTKLIIGIPTRGNDISSGLLSFILNTIPHLDICILLGESSVSATLAVEILWKMLVDKLGTFDYYMQIDSDIIPPVGALESMLTKDKDIVVAPIWHYDPLSKDIHINIHLNNLRERIYGLRTGGCDKIYASSLGCVLMKHKVIETFVKAGENPIKWSPLLGEYTGEDIHNDNVFFAKANKLGLEVWVDWGVKNVVHRRTIELSTEVLDRFISRSQMGRRDESKLGR